MDSQVVSLGSYAMGYVICPHCGTISGFGRTIEETIAAWNRRANDE